jgi:FkbM family methyltransferase
MNKISAFFGLKGKSQKDNSLISKEKIKYMFYRVLGTLFKKSFFTMGEGMSSNVLARNSYGLFFCRKKSADLHIISDSYEFDVRILFENLSKKSKIILDIGANVGKYSVLACKVNPYAKVFAFEPSKGNFKALEINKNINKCKNLFINKVALSNKKGKVKLYDGPGSGRYSLKGKSKNFEDVEANKLDNLFKNLTIDLIKMDVEGAELDLLEGSKRLLSKKRIKRMIIEIDPENEKRVMRMMHDFGYRIKRIQYNNFLFYQKDL